ncbi:MAG: hypothetical protein QUS07_07295 [Methanothrix sp.]|nr:hypothetical protein [Methanothrix sp.]
MKHILIPPIPELRHVAGMSHYLSLSHLIQSSPEYAEFYSTESKRGAYVILDNSAHEFQAGQTIEILMKQGAKIQAKEIVLPDRLFSAQSTILGCQVALDKLLDMPAFRSGEYRPRLMIVAQGESPADLQRCAEKMCHDWETYSIEYPQIFDRPPVLGVSKDYEVFPGGLKGLLETIFFPLQEDLTTEIHLLGWGRKLWDLSGIAYEYGKRIRSVDSAKPFVYGLNGIRLDPREVPPPYPKRSPTYFQTQLTKDQRLLAEFNSQIFEATSRGEV